MRNAILLLVLVTLTPAGLPAADLFVGALAGISTISADARTTGSPPQTFSAYKPENGPTAMLFAGTHILDYFSIQATYSFNRNSVVLSGSDIPQSASYQQPARISMHTVVAEALVYFRPRQSRVRPYLSAGPGITRATVAATGPGLTTGPITLPPLPSPATGPSLRVAVGIDLRIASSLALRYSFAETIQGNTLAKSLVPQGRRNLANFQNLLGISWIF